MTRARRAVALVWGPILALVALSSLSISLVLGAGLAVWQDPTRGRPAAIAPDGVIRPPGSGVITVPATPRPSQPVGPVAAPPSAPADVDAVPVAGPETAPPAPRSGARERQASRHSSDSTPSTDTGGTPATSDGNVSHPSHPGRPAAHPAEGPSAEPDSDSSHGWHGNGPPPWAHHGQWSAHPGHHAHPPGHQGRGHGHAAGHGRHHARPPGRAHLHECAEESEQRCPTSSGHQGPHE